MITPLLKYRVTPLGYDGKRHRAIKEWDGGIRDNYNYTSWDAVHELLELDPYFWGFRMENATGGGRTYARHAVGVADVTDLADRYREVEQEMMDLFDNEFISVMREVTYDADVHADWVKKNKVLQDEKWSLVDKCCERINARAADYEAGKK